MQQEWPARRYAANALWLVLAEAAAKLTGFVFIVLVARSLGTRDFGYFSFAFAFVPLLLVVGHFGLESTVIREIARDRRRLSEVFASGVAIRTLLGLGGLTFALAAGPLFLDGGRPYAVLALVGVAVLLDELANFVGTVFRAFEHMQYHALALLVNRLVSTALAVLAVALDAGVIAVCLTYLAGSLAATGFALVVLRRNFPPIDYRQASRPVAARLVQTGLPLALAGVLNTALFRIDTVMLQAIRGPVEVGLYNVAYRFFESILFVAWALGNLVLPRISREGAGARAARTYGVSALLSLAFYLPIALTLPFASEWVVTTLFSDRYEEASSVVGVLAGAALLYAVAYASRMGAIALGRNKEIAIVAGITLGVNVLLNAFAIPRYGFEGAAWSTFAAEAVEAVLLIGLFLRVNGSAPQLRLILTPVAAAVVLATALLASGFTGPAALVLAVVVYVPALGLSALVLVPDEARRLTGVLRRTEHTTA